MVSVVQSQLDAYVSEFPKQDKITFADLQQEGYLSKRQVKEAQDNGIKIKASKVVK
ncbi:hypothetical protein NBRC111893_1305 [Lentilactobacillus kosonis]|uniref:Uncharacterized protein n=1 Tax=Lentilactobacillus kosonis TaxID=2810561 RepID=A0A401FLA0_9LACO|nr:hypothetical protein NBRC111893_1305 [Lentilactobacillus kosonis]